MARNRLLLLVEGQGDVAAAPVLLKRLLAEYGAFDSVIPDPRPWCVKGYSKIARENFAEWHRYLGTAAKAGDLGGCILLLDGDSKWDAERQPFCAMRAARRLGAEAQEAGAGRLFSLAVVFACKEFESWLIAGAESLVGKAFSDRRKGVTEITTVIPSDPEFSPRDAKGWLNHLMKNTGYSPSRDQAELTRLVDLAMIRQKMRSFRRLESAVRGIVEAIRSGSHVVTPTPE